LILLDVMLPGKDGFSICRDLRREGLKVPVILLTARGQESDRVRGLDLGANDYVVKPFSSSELMARVRRLLREQEDSRKDHKQFQDEVRAAAAVQEGLFPRDRPPIAGLDYSAICRPARGVSGDYYDFIRFRCENRPAQECVIDSSYYATNKLLMNCAWPTGSPLAIHLTLPFLTMSIASIPRKVRHAVASEP